MEKRKRASGGKRAVEKKHLERAAKRDPDFDERLEAEFRQVVGDPPYDRPDAAHGWWLKLAMFAASKTLLDRGVPFEQRCTRLAAIAAQGIKAVDPAQQGARLDQLEEALEKAQRDAAYGPQTRSPGTDDVVDECEDQP